MLADMVIIASAFLATEWTTMDEDKRAALTQCGVDAAEYDRLMALDARDFDQDFEGGWRAVSDRDDCALAAAALVESYLVVNAVSRQHSLYDTMVWHVGQMYASAGRSEDALPWLRLSYDPQEEGEQALLWRLYAEGTIAFLERDRPALQAARDELAAQTVSEQEKAARQRFLDENPRIRMPPGFVDEPQNLNVLDGLLACFDRPYEEAYGRRCQRRARR